MQAIGQNSGGKLSVVAAAPPPPWPSPPHWKGR